MLAGELMGNRLDNTNVEATSHNVMRIVCWPTLAGVAVAILCLVALTLARPREKAPSEYQELHVSSSIALGMNRPRVGAPSALYTLVEFADFDCPPCRAIRSKLASLLKRRADKLAMVFRHLPLVNIHPEAHDKAILAEAAYDQGMFWEMYSYLCAATCKCDLAELKQDRSAPRLDFGKCKEAMRS